MDKIKRIKELAKELENASYAYYAQDNPIMSDKQYDDLYDELSVLENETGFILAGSPTQKVQGYVLDKFTKVKHSKPMLSANKTKDVNEIKKFLKDNKFYCSYKLDGLTLVVKYKNGEFIQGITRGSGTEGEDVTEQCKFISNLPMKIQNKNELELRGECVISWSEFDRINSKLENPYSHPRNLASGTLRNLDLNIVKDRKLSFIVFEMVRPTFTSKLDGLKALEEMGFECVGRTGGVVENCIKAMQPEYYSYPCDGLIFELDSSELSKSLGSTEHHENCRIALKWADDLYETTLTDIEWNTSKSGLINPVAVFEPVDLNGAMTTRATLHNISYIEDLELGVGDTIKIYRANMVIPKVHDNLTRNNTWKLPSKCPNCGGEVEVHNENGSKTLHCINPDCPAKLLGQLSHFVSKNAINIENLSEQTLQKFIDFGWVSSFQDIMNLKDHSNEMMKLEGFGKKSVNKLMDAIEKSKKTTLERFIYSLSIPLIGRSASKDISRVCHGDERIFISMIKSNELYKLIEDIDGFGDAMYKSLFGYCKMHVNDIEDLLSYFEIEKENNKIGATNLSGKTFVITGSLNHYKNRDELMSVIESMDGKVSGSVSSKTDYLINNNVNSSSSKNVKAKKLGIPIITEEEFINMIS